MVVSVEASRRASRSTHGTLHFAVRDTGHRHPRGQERLSSSRPFAQARHPRRRASTAAPGWAWRSPRLLVEMMGGRIWVESDAGRGQHVPLHRPLRRRAAGRDRGASGRRACRACRCSSSTTTHQPSHPRGDVDHWGMRPVAVDGGQAALARVEDALPPLGEPFSRAARRAHARDGRLRAGRPIAAPTGHGRRDRDAHVEPAHGRDAPAARSSASPPTWSSRSRSATCSAACIGRSGAAIGPSAGPPMPRDPAGPPAPAAGPRRRGQRRELRLATPCWRSGHSGTVVGNGQAAVEASREAVRRGLMDVQMPEMGGLDATRLIREAEARAGAARADRRADRARDEGRPRGMPGRGHGRLRDQAGAAVRPRGRDRAGTCRAAGAARAKGDAA